MTSPESRDVLPDQTVRNIGGEPFCGKCGDHLVAGWQEEPYCPTCEFPRCVATAPAVPSFLIDQWEAEVARLRAENEAQRERIASLMLEEPSKSAGLYAAIDELQRGIEALRENLARMQEAGLRLTAENEARGEYIVRCDMALEQQDTELARLRAENETYREALEWIRHQTGTATCDDAIRAMNDAHDAATKALAT